MLDSCARNFALSLTMAVLTIISSSTAIAAGPPALVAAAGPREPPLVSPAIPGSTGGIHQGSGPNDSTEGASLEIEITAQAFSVSPGSQLWVEALISIPGRDSVSESLGVAVQVGRPIQSLSALRAAAEDPRGATLRTVAEFPVSLPPRSDATAAGPMSVPVSYRAAVNAPPSEESAISFPATGVYLLQLSLHSGSPSTDALATAETFVEFSYSRPDPRLLAALVAPIAAPPTTGPLASDGGHGAQSDRSSQEIDRISRLARSYEAAGTLPLTLAIQPSTLSDLVAAADFPDATAGNLLGSLLGLAPRPEHELLPLPFSVLPASFYSSPMLERDLNSQWELGRKVLHSITGRAATTEVALPPTGGFDLQALERVADLGFGAAILHTTDFSEQRSPARTQPVLAGISGGGALPAYPAYDEISPALSALDAKVLRLSPATVAASLVVSAIESPSLRGALLLPPYAWDPDPEGLSALLGMLQQTPWVLPVTVSELFRDVPLAVRSGRARAIAQIRTAALPGAAGGLAQALEDASIAADGLESMAGTESRPAMEARMGFLQAPSVALEADPLSVNREALALVEAAYLRVSGYVRETVSKVSLPPATGITLTAQSSLIPLRIENALAQPLQVAVTLQSDKLVFVEGERLSPVTVAPGGSTLNIPVEAEATGAFSLHVSLSSPDGKLILLTQRLQVRFMRMGPVAIFLGLGALSVLGFWWVRQILTRRRPGANPHRPRATTG